MKIGALSANNTTTNYQCYVCGSAQTTGKHTVFYIPDLVSYSGSSGLSEWMCGGCLAVAIQKGNLTLHTREEPATPPPPSGGVEEEEETTTFEVGWGEEESA